MKICDVCGKEIQRPQHALDETVLYYVEKLVPIPEVNYTGPDERLVSKLASTTYIYCPECWEKRQKSNQQAGSVSFYFAN